MTSRWWEIKQDTDRYGEFHEESGLRYPPRITVYGTLEQAKRLATYLDFNEAGCTGYFYVDEDRVRDVALSSRGDAPTQQFQPLTKDVVLQWPDFDNWWEADGRFYDPDTSDVPWYDKRQSLAEYAFLRAKQLIKQTAYLQRASQGDAGTPEWVSVEDRLPDANGEFLIVETADKEASTADFRKDEAQWWTVRSYGQDCEERELYSVTHWMELPALPRAEAALAHREAPREPPKCPHCDEPVMRGYLMKCCGCGLIHRLNFRVVTTAKGVVKVQFQAFRHRESSNASR